MMTDFGTIVFVKRTHPGRLIGYVRPDSAPPDSRHLNLWFGELSTQGHDVREGLGVGFERATKGTDRIFKLWPETKGNDHGK